MKDGLKRKIVYCQVASVILSYFPGLFSSGWDGGVLCVWLVGFVCFVVVGFVVAWFFSVLFVVVLPCRYQSPDCDLSVLYRIKTENKNM